MAARLPFTYLSSLLFFFRDEKKGETSCDDIEMAMREKRRERERERERERAEATLAYFSHHCKEAAAHLYFPSRHFSVSQKSKEKVLKTLRAVKSF